MKRFSSVYSIAVFAAVDWGDTLVATKAGTPKDIATIGSIVPLFTNIVQAVMALSGVALLVMLLVGGFNFLFSGGDPKKVQAAAGTLGSAFLGLVVIVIAYLILSTIGKFTGVENITKFGITVPN